MASRELRETARARDLSIVAITIDGRHRNLVGRRGRTQIETLFTDAEIDELWVFTDAEIDELWALTQKVLRRINESKQGRGQEA